MNGPLRGIRVLELAGIGPLPFAGMVLADLGAEVTRIDSPAAAAANPERYRDGLSRGKRSVLFDFRSPQGRGVLRQLVAGTDVLLEGFRPGALERLGLDPDELLAAHPDLVIVRANGWGADGPRARSAGHDLNYAGITGALHAMGPAHLPPPVPLNLVADYGGGGMLVVVGALAALHTRARDGGQVVDAAMVDGVALMMTKWFGELATGRITDARESHRLNGAAPFYRTYTTADGAYLAVGALEPKFFANLLTGLGISGGIDQMDESSWPEVTERFAAIFRSQPLSHWVTVFGAPNGPGGRDGPDGLDACVTPILSMTEALADDHLAERDVFVDVDGLRLPAPAPRFSRTPARAGSLPPPGAHTAEVLGALGLPSKDLAELADPAPPPASAKEP